MKIKKNLCFDGLKDGFSYLKRIFLSPIFTSKKDFFTSKKPIFTLKNTFSYIKNKLNRGIKNE